MFWNYIHVAWRNMLNNKMHSAINIFGLSIGLATCMMIALFVQDETTYDQFWAKADHVYRVDAHLTLPGRETATLASTPGNFKAAMDETFSDVVVNFARVYDRDGVVKIGDKALFNKISVVDPEIATIFDLPVIAGDLAAALADANGIALFEQDALKIFGSTDVLGETLRLSVYAADRDFEVRAVLKDLPHNTTMAFGSLISLQDNDFEYETYLIDNWYSFNNTSFAELKPGSSLETLHAQLVDFVDANITSPFTDENGQPTKTSEMVEFEFKPLLSLQLGGSVNNQMKPVGSQQRVALFAIIALLILSLACINFVNLTTAKATQRAREVALRKVLGAERRQLMVQFFGESLLLALTALGVSLVLLEAGLPLLNTALNRELALNFGMQTIMLIGGLMAVVGLLGGVYPAMVLSGFRPAFVLRANKSADVGGVSIVRQILVIAQFSVSIVLLIATAVIYGQMLFISNQNPGYRTDNMLVVHNGYRMGGSEQQQQFMGRLASLPGVTAVARGNGYPMQGNQNNESFRLPSDPETKSTLIGVEEVGAAMLDLYEVDVIAGRMFDAARESDYYPRRADVAEGGRTNANVIINTLAAAKMGHANPADAIGQEFIQGLGRNAEGQSIQGRMTVVGVIDPLRFQSLKQPLRPMFYKLQRRAMGHVHLAYQGDGERLRQRIEAQWVSQYPDVPFSYDFVDGVMTREFTEERGMAQLLGAFAGLAILIACLGLFGLASFTAARRTKEIGIRKVLGARVFDVVRLLVWQFSRPILLANLIAWPIAYVAMSSWLQSFPFRLDLWLIWPIAAAAGLLALLIAWATVGGNAAIVARLNPAFSLRQD